MAGEFTIEAFKDFFLQVTDSVIHDAASKGQRFPVASLHFAVDENGGELYGADYIKYILKDTGRGPGKQPPPDKMTEFVRDTPGMLSAFEQRFPGITAAQAGFLIGRKIGIEGTEIWKGTKEGVDLLGSIDKHMPELLLRLGKDIAFSVATDLRQAVKR